MPSFAFSNTFAIHSASQEIFRDRGTTFQSRSRKVVGSSELIERDRSKKGSAKIDRESLSLVVPRTMRCDHASKKRLANKDAE